MSWTQAGHCSKCGAPIWYETFWSGTIPPPAQYSCACFSNNVKITTTINAQDFNDEEIKKHPDDFDGINCPKCGNPFLDWASKDHGCDKREDPAEKKLRELKEWINGKNPLGLSPLQMTEKFPNNAETGYKICLRDLLSKLTESEEEK